MASTDERLKQAIAAARAGNTDEAREIVDGLVEENPDNPHAIFLRGMLASSEAEQLEYMNRVLEIDPDHKAANRRLAQIAPTAEDDATVLISGEPEAEEIEEDSGIEDVGTVETMVGAAVVDPAEEVLTEDLSEQPTDEQGDWGVTQTVVTAAAVGADIESPEDDSTMIEAAIPEEIILEEEVVAEAVVPEELSLEDDVVEEAAADGADDTVIAVAAATGVVAATDQGEEIPDWLIGESDDEQELPTESSQDIWIETKAEEVDELPDWLTEDPAEEWAESGAEDATVLAATAAGEDDFDDSWASDDEVEEDLDDQVETTTDELIEDDVVLDDDEDEVFDDQEADVPDEEQIKGKSSTRGLEFALAILIGVAILIVIGILFVIVDLSNLL